MTVKRRVDIAVVGGGAKAAALCAKAFALRRASAADVHVTVFEKQAIGAYWSGKGGYTDGEQRLCTPAERDAGFPYMSIYGEQVDVELYSQFSWSSFLLARPQAYSRWVDGGRRAPTHKEFATYLGWTVQRSGATVVVGEVQGLKSTGKKWQLQHRNSSGKLVLGSALDFDGVVISGPGPPRALSVIGGTGRVFNGTDFWLRLNEVRKILRASGADASVAIVGAGGTAAAILAWLTRNGHRDHEMVMVADQAALFTRGDSVFENRLFSDDQAWQALSTKSREEFFNRLNRGVVWSSVMDEVSSASRLVFVAGRAAKVTASPKGLIEVTVHRGDGKKVSLRPSIVVDASGFDAWWFLDLIRAVPAAKRRDREFRKVLQEGMSRNLSFSGASWSLPPLHAPFLSSAIGPGYASLMSLGGMSDLVFCAYTST